MMKFEAPSPRPGKPAEVPPEAQAIFRDDDEAAVNEFHPLSHHQPNEDFTDSTRDLLEGSEMKELLVGPDAVALLARQRARYTQLQIDITSLRHQLDDPALSVEERSRLTQSLSQLEGRASRMGEFLRKARGYVGPLH